MNNTVISEVIQQMEALPVHLQQQVLAFIQELATLVRRGIPGRQMLRFAGTIPPDDLQLMYQAIKEDCERIVG
jgi:hypothetical protein